MIKGCGNCANYVWGDNKTPLPSDCITCITTHVPNGQHPTPSHWKALPQTNADRIRVMSDEELAKLIYEADSLGYCKNLPECARLLDAPGGIPEEKCMGCLMAWLRAPAEDS